ncbi:MAG: PDZ domain-containing protein [Acidimicrobiales bacterium]
MAGDDPGSGGDRDDDNSDINDGDWMRGWIHPDDRLWRHPSERAPSRHGATAGDHIGSITSGSLGRRGAAPWLICGSLCIALAVAAVAVIVADTGQDPTNAVTTSLSLVRSAPTTEPGPVNVLSGDQVDNVVASVRPSTVVLRVVRTGHVATVMGLVVEAGGIVVTTARAVTDATRITVVEPDGSRQPAEFVGIDSRSNLAVFHIADDLPAATFDDEDPTTGSVAMAVTMRPRRKAQPAPLVYAGTVLSSGVAVPGDPVTATFAATAVRTPLDADDLGCPLVDDQGHVVGMLEYTTRLGTSKVAVFLPGALVAGVARQLVASGEVDHGWLGVEGPASAATPASSALVTTPASALQSSGALLGAVVKDSPAALAGLAAGDVVMAVDGAPVHSMSELMTRLYPDPPGMSVEVTFERWQATETVDVQLAEPDAE